MSIWPLMVALALLGSSAAARAQDAGTHPTQLVGVWVHEDSATAQSPIRWSFIHFMADGSYRAARREAADTGDGQGEKEPVTGGWAVVSTQTRGSLLCTRAEVAEESRCDSYRIEPAGPRPLWRDLGFTSAPPALLRRLGLARF